MFLDDFRLWRCQNMVNTSTFSFTSTKIAQNTVFLDVFNLKYLSRNHNNNNNNNKKKKKKKKNIWHLVSLVRADPAAERREYKFEMFEVLSLSFCILCISIFVRPSSSHPQARGFTQSLQASHDLTPM